MEFDPLARDAPPPRHDLESDSENSEEEGLDGAPGQARKSKPFVRPNIQIEGSLEQTERKPSPMLIAVGIAGEAYVAAQFPLLLESASLTVDGEQEASIHVFDDANSASESSRTALLLLRPSSVLSSNLAAFAFVASTLVDSFHPSSLMVLDEYTPQLYHLKDPTSGLGSDPPVRYLTSSISSSSSEQSIETELQFYQAPNYITGLTASLLTTASAQSIPSMALLVPSSSPRPPVHYPSSRQRSDQPSQPLHQIQARADPLEAHLVDIVERQLKKWPGVKLPKSGSQQGIGGTKTLTSFLDERRQRARRHLAESAGSMYV